jgi:hypothetical protein
LQDVVQRAIDFLGTPLRQNRSEPNRDEKKGGERAWGTEDHTNCSAKCQPQLSCSSQPLATD